ncbi:MAG: uroporphyrinogen-III synthase [Planctomycetota bacterium]|nr:uroporphyrinogen-III synthase [Planctomycetota bacterium]
MWLTRSEEGNRAWQAPVLASGATPISLPCLQFDFMPENTDSTRTVLSEADWVVFSSPRGVQAFMEMGLNLAVNQRVACVGESTGQSCTEALRKPDLVAKDGCAEGMARDLISVADWHSAVLIGALDPRPELAQWLREAGKESQSCPVYRTTATPLDSHPVTIESGDAVFLASPSAFESLSARCDLDPQVALISIGPSTSATIRAAGFAVAAESKTRTVQGMLAALAGMNQAAQ